MNIPNIRFNGFSDPWKQQKLSDFMDFSNGFNGNAELYGHGIPYISVMDILNNDYISYDCIRGKVDINNETLIRQFLGVAESYCFDKNNTLYKKYYEKGYKKIKK